MLARLHHCLLCCTSSKGRHDTFASYLYDLKSAISQKCFGVYKVFHRQIMQARSCVNLDEEKTKWGCMSSKAKVSTRQPLPPNQSP
eukprot:4206920-Pleurochrysis_carterae.AAC.3